MDVSADSRAALMARLRTAPIDLSEAYARPRLFDVAALLAGDAVLEAGDAMPAQLALSAEHMRSDGAFLLDDGLALRLWIGRDAPPALLEQLLAGAAELGISGPPELAATNAQLDAQPLQRRPATRVRVRGSGDTPVLEPENDRSIGVRFAGLLDLVSRLGRVCFAAHCRAAERFQRVASSAALSRA